LASSKEKMIVKIRVWTLPGSKTLSLFSVKSFSNYNRPGYTLEEIFTCKVWGFGGSGMDGTQQRPTGPHISLAIFMWKQILITLMVSDWVRIQCVCYRIGMFTMDLVCKAWLKNWVDSKFFSKCLSFKGERINVVIS
jgi:hypothetical protein